MINRDPSPSWTPEKGSRERAFSPVFRYVRASGPAQPTEWYSTSLSQASLALRCGGPPVRCLMICPCPGVCRKQNRENQACGKGGG